MKKVLYKNYFETPLGQMVSITDLERLYLLEFIERKNLGKELEKLKALFKMEQNELSTRVEKEVGEYFRGERKRFDLPLVLEGTEFQKNIWLEVEQTPFGPTRSYKEIAQKIENPRASIAVGAANAANRYAIIIPCHRLKKSTGKLAGYAAGIWRKEWLLNFEEEVENDS